MQTNKITNIKDSTFVKNTVYIPIQYTGNQTNEMKDTYSTSHSAITYNQPTI